MMIEVFSTFKLTPIIPVNSALMVFKRLFFVKRLFCSGFYSIFVKRFTRDLVYYNDPAHSNQRYSY